MIVLNFIIFLSFKYTLSLRHSNKLPKGCVCVCKNMCLCVNMCFYVCCLFSGSEHMYHTHPSNIVINMMWIPNKYMHVPWSSLYRKDNTDNTHEYPGYRWQKSNSLKYVDSRVQKKRSEKMGQSKYFKG